MEPSFIPRYYTIQKSSSALYLGSNYLLTLNLSAFVLLKSFGAQHAVTFDISRSSVIIECSVAFNIPTLSCNSRRVIRLSSSKIFWIHSILLPVFEEFGRPGRGSSWNQQNKLTYKLHRVFQKFSSQICISNKSENGIFSICPLYSLRDQLPIYILVYFKKTIIVVLILDFCASV